MRTSFTHCALHSADIEASVAFYRDYCGLNVVHSHGEPPGHTVWMASQGDEKRFVMVIVPGGEGHEQPPGDMTHYGMAVGERADIDRIAERARKDGCLHWEPQEHSWPVGYLCAVRDPDGYIVEFSYGQPLGPGAKSASGDD